MGNRWVDEVWWRDWLFWVGAVVASAPTALAVAETDAPAWRLFIAWWCVFGIVVAVLGFVRTAWRAYREP